MADVVNLRRFRKAQQRAARASEAERNRAAFGRPPEERQAAAEDRARADARLDAHRLDPASKPSQD